MFKRKSKDIIRFYCDSKYHDIIPKPFKASRHIPDWYRCLPPTTDNTISFKTTVKKCAPFVEAMIEGWLIPLVADVHFTTSGEGGVSAINTNSNFPEKIVDSHSIAQISSEEHPNPILPKQPLKFINYWYIETLPGWSVLFTPPLNRPNPHFTCFSGIVECDKYHNIVNFPFVFNTPNTSDIIPAGTPLVQAIPFKRHKFNKTICSAFTEEIIKKRNKTNLQMNICQSFYRDKIWRRD